MHGREERPQFHAISCGWAKATCDLTKSPGTGQLGAIGVREYRVGRQKRQNGLWAGEKGRSGEGRVVKSGLMGSACWPLESREMSVLGS